LFCSKKRLSGSEDNEVQRLLSSADKSKADNFGVIALKLLESVTTTPMFNNAKSFKQGN
jgi:hypothetical protein